MTDDYRTKIGKLISELRINHGLTQSQLAAELGTSQSAINRIEKGAQNVSLEIIARISDVLNSEIITMGNSNKLNLRIHGGQQLSGEIDINTSKNAGVGLLCASLLNKGKTTLRHVARIEEVNRIIEVLNSIGVKTKWLNKQNDLEIIPPAKLRLDQMDVAAAKRTRSILMFLGPLLHQYNDFKLPFAGGCSLGVRTVKPHLAGLSAFGMKVEVPEGEDYYHATVEQKQPANDIILIERGDTATENIIMAAALCPSETIIRNASPNYMVQDVCFFLQKLGVEIDGIGTTVLRIRGRRQINQNIEYYVSEDPIEAMSFVAAAVITHSEITIKRVPIEFVELELATLGQMGLQYELSSEYYSHNGKTRLVDLLVKRSRLTAPQDKLAALPFPGINQDNLPFLALIATAAEGRTLVHDWAYENRAIYLTELNRLNASINLVDPHRVYINGPTKWKAADIVAPPALRPSVVILLAMLAAPGTSTLRDVYNINRGYQDFYNRLNSLGAQIETFREI
ncbi:MAG: UDP-N-acetylglucosamine 1-carboxyvinyltransferase [Candidatus Saccharibacteria bacterium]|nr:UDP-N-acetylglucosamine 1-carboxyvinyltransferase [Candidatus Saccharibacteria bacterium]